MNAMIALSTGLQWGRFTEEAETLPAACTHPRNASSFNGAASLRKRKHRGGGGWGGGDAGFNGAASLRKRKPGIPRAGTADLSPLQWGRFTEEAETARVSFPNGSYNFWLQWGRFTEEAETCCMAPVVTTVLWSLQWGRFTEEAETFAEILPGPAGAVASMGPLH